MISYTSDEPHQDNFYSGMVPPELLNFDLYHHLKENIKEFEKNCKCNSDGNITFYCVTCRMSTCKLCNKEAHNSHHLVKRNSFSVEKESIDRIFNYLEQRLDQHDKEFILESIKQEYQYLIESQIQVLHNKLDEIKTKKLEEVENMFKKDLTTTVLRNEVNEIKKHRSCNA